MSSLMSRLAAGLIAFAIAGSAVACPGAKYDKSADRGGSGSTSSTQTTPKT